MHKTMHKNDHPKSTVGRGYYYAPKDEDIVLELKELRESPERLSTDGSITHVTYSDTVAIHPRDLNWDPEKYMYDNVRYCWLRRPNTGKKKTCRVTQSGNSWKNTGQCVDVCGGEAQKLKLTLDEEKISWTMHEYTLKDNRTANESVICRIEKKMNNSKDKEKGTPSPKSKKRKERAAGTKNSRESGTSSEGTQESVIAAVEQHLFDEPINDDPTINVEGSLIYKDLERIICAGHCHNPSSNEYSCKMQDPQAV